MNHKRPKDKLTFNHITYQVYQKHLIQSEELEDQE